MTTPLNKIEFKTSAGKTTSLAEHEGKVVLVVNVASKCGLTPQYEALEKLFEKYQSKGFVVTGFPANEFGAQEPGSNEEIQEFCQLNFGVKFPVYAKIVVKGEGIHPLYAALTSAAPEATKEGDAFEKKLAQHGLLKGKAEEIQWNFEKFLINKAGKVVGRFAPDMAPDAAVIVKAIEAELAK